MPANPDHFISLTSPKAYSVLAMVWGAGQEATHKTEETLLCGEMASAGQ